MLDGEQKENYLVHFGNDILIIIEVTHMKDNPEIKSITECIVREYRPDKIILFGSWARGHANAQSDIDLLVISDREKRLPRYKRGLNVRLLLSQFSSPKDILFYTHEDVERWRDVPQTFINTVLREGRVLYER
jgi:predicted nucleotidyltransferase